MSIGTSNSDLARKWRSSASDGNPAGALYVAGEHAEADMIGRTVGGSGKCGTACSGSYTRHCC